MKKNKRGSNKEEGMVKTKKKKAKDSSSSEDKSIMKDEPSNSQNSLQIDSDEIIQELMITIQKNQLVRDILIEMIALYKVSNENFQKEMTYLRKSNLAQEMFNVKKDKMMTEEKQCYEEIFNEAFKKLQDLKIIGFCDELSLNRTKSKESVLENKMNNPILNMLITNNLERSNSAEINQREMKELDKLRRIVFLKIIKQKLVADEKISEYLNTHPNLLFNRKKNQSNLIKHSSVNEISEANYDKGRPFLINEIKPPPIYRNESSSILHIEINNTELMNDLVPITIPVRLQDILDIKDDFSFSQFVKSRDIISNLEEFENYISQRTAFLQESMNKISKEKINNSCILQEDREKLNYLVKSTSSPQGKFNYSIIEGLNLSAELINKLSFLQKSNPKEYEELKKITPPEYILECLKNMK